MMTSIFNRTLLAQSQLLRNREVTAAGVSQFVAITWVAPVAAFFDPSLFGYAATALTAAPVIPQAINAFRWLPTAERAPNVTLNLRLARQATSFSILNAVGAAPFLAYQAVQANQMRVQQPDSAPLTAPATLLLAGVALALTANGVRAWRRRPLIKTLLHRQNALEQN